MQGRVVEGLGGEPHSSASVGYSLQSHQERKLHPILACSLNLVVIKVLAANISRQHGRARVEESPAQSPVCSLGCHDSFASREPSLRRSVLHIPLDHKHTDGILAGGQCGQHRDIRANPNGRKVLKPFSKQVNTRRRIWPNPNPGTH
ncbi:hypothetical protein B0T26DRAFT_728602 [Lasiosphaeria miniovina]|uniref:Uncharacterized protein n=1 Tax=Lasiosphaeria miniovina TaxID=1954250 RepID=A0AA40A0E5_9PEZI|nr:uncharacterized protein B0T26DRAFT_728602 [Lasiosphaeria miniovina]KAK0706920.1 hypothetical protein B0T26DRAFT_728602 [Lasiosphaeria miniovina]